MLRYTINHTVALVIPLFFKMFRGQAGLHFLRANTLSLSEIRSLFPDQDMRRRWLTRNASWRNMFVSQPPIQEIHWHLRRQNHPRREDQPEPESGPLPATIAVFKFPDGLRMGDFYDLVLGTISKCRITWPSLEYRPGSFMDWDSQDPDTWDIDQLNKAFRAHAILIQKYVLLHDPPEYEQRDMFWNPTNLRKYHQNLVVVALRAWRQTAGGDVEWSYVSQGNDAAAMELFLGEAQEPGS
ncbi:hypothetical protein F4811DRAFT_500049 [Daldinia bambusicola]|nr:hypothetical protein F4811DRAFT_500049 [Daldinia bambusicola]